MHFLPMMEQFGRDLDALETRVAVNEVNITDLSVRVAALEGIPPGELPPPDPPPDPPPVEPPPPAGVWPDHEPAGMTRILVADGSNKHYGDASTKYGAKWDDPGRVVVVVDPDAKYNGRAIEKRFRVGDGDGWNGFANDNNFPDAYSELYVRTVFKYSINWQHHKSGQKLFYWGAQKTGAANCFYFLTKATGELRFRNQCGNGLDEAVFKANNFTGMTVGKYHTVEGHIIANTLGQADGSMRVWVDGVELISWNKLGHPQDNIPLTNREWFGSGSSDNRFDGYQSWLYWGGGADTKRVNDWVRISEFYISGKL